MYFDNLLLKSTNKPSTTWNIVKTVTNNVTTSSNIAEMNINNNYLVTPPQVLMLSMPIFLHLQRILHIQIIPVRILRILMIV